MFFQLLYTFHSLLKGNLSECFKCIFSDNFTFSTYTFTNLSMHLNVTVHNYESVYAFTNLNTLANLKARLHAEWKKKNFREILLYFHTSGQSMHKVGIIVGLACSGKLQKCSPSRPKGKTRKSVNGRKKR